MCANYKPPTIADLASYVGIDISLVFPPETFPGYSAPILRMSDAGELECVSACFGLIPHWSKDRTIARNTYNARSETVGEKPSFRDAWKAPRLCLVPLQEFYEPWYTEGEKRSVRWRIARRDGEIFAAAGIWGSWLDKATGEIVTSFSMLTINADNHPIMRELHKQGEEKRSIVLLPSYAHDDWLALKDSADAKGFLLPFDQSDFFSEAAPRTQVPN